VTSTRKNQSDRTTQTQSNHVITLNRPNTAVIITNPESHNVQRYRQTDGETTW